MASGDPREPVGEPVQKDALLKERSAALVRECMLQEARLQKRQTCRILFPPFYSWSMLAIDHHTIHGPHVSRVKDSGVGVRHRLSASYVCILYKRSVLSSGDYKLPWLRPQQKRSAINPKRART